ncbi:MAG: HAMP domain-containing histidine kinase [Thiobacillus sp.]|nr:HAMP domain-containing histidine kinase [Thiobacillus sp.]
MKASSLRRRVLVSMVVVIVVTVGCLSLYLHGTRDILRRGLMHIQAKEIAAAFIASGNIDHLPREYAGGEVSYTLYGADREVLWVSSGRTRPLRYRDDTLESLRWRFWHRLDVGRFINVALPLEDGRTLMISRRDQNERAAIEALLDARLKQSLVLAIPLALTLAALVWFLMAWALAPVRRAAQAAEAIAPGQIRQIPEAPLPEEIRPLVRALNRVAVRLGESLEAEREILANGAHELRTPLTVLDLRLQKFEQDGQVDWPEVREDLQRLRRVVEQLLQLARSEDAAATEAAGTCLLAALVREAVAGVYPLFEAEGRAVRAELGNDEPRVCGTADAVLEAVTNGLENALAHGRGTVCIRLSVVGAHVLLDIQDEGEGVPLERQSEYFRRFHKGRQDSPGAGLGLAIVQRIMLNLGGTVEFVSCTPGILRYRFPLAAGHGPESAAV